VRKPALTATSSPKKMSAQMQITSFSEDFSGLVVMFDPEHSAVAKAMNIKEKGKYALKVR
jgi:RNA polymerase subunit RPABC4/transcription elongation factor Spt4